MKGRLFRVMMLPYLVLLGMAICPVHGQESRSVTLQTPTAVRNSLRYFRFTAGHCLPDNTPSMETGTDSATARITVPDVATPLRATRETVRRGAGNAGAIFNDTVRRFQVFGNWCSNTGQKVANLYNVIADSCRRLHIATAGFSSSKAQAAALPAAATPSRPAVEPEHSGNYQYRWENEQGDRIYSLSPDFDPNHGGPPVWRRIK